MEEARGNSSKQELAVDRALVRSPRTVPTQPHISYCSFNGSQQKPMEAVVSRHTLPSGNLDFRWGSDTDLRDLTSLCPIHSSSSYP